MPKICIALSNLIDLCRVWVRVWPKFETFLFASALRWAVRPSWAGGVGWAWSDLVFWAGLGYRAWLGRAGRELHSIVLVPRSRARGSLGAKTYLVSMGATMCLHPHFLPG